MPDFSVPSELDFSSPQFWGYVACALVLLTFAMRSMQRLRYVAILSNIVFIYYAGALDLLPIFILHAVLLPLNIWRLIELWGEPEPHDGHAIGTGRVAATAESPSGTSGPVLVTSSEPEWHNEPSSRRRVLARNAG